MAIKVVYFDCGGVVLRVRENDIYQRWEAELQLQPGELAARLWQSDAYRRAEIGQLGEDAFWREVAPALPGISPGQLDRLRQDMWDVFALNEQVMGWVDRLHRHYRVAILSNATEILDEMLQTRYRITDRFDAIYNSARLGVAKPSADIFQRVLRAQNINAAEALFIDDRAENVSAAAQQGMHVLWYVNDQELDRQLQVYDPDAR